MSPEKYDGTVGAGAGPGMQKSGDVVIHDHTTLSNAIVAESSSTDSQMETHGTKVHVGHVEMNKGFGLLSCLGIALTCLNSITAMSASLSVVLPSGGPVAMLYGLFVSAAGTLCMAASLAEICSAYPTVGGQFEWTHILAPFKWKRSLSWFSGWMAVSAWVSLAASGSSLGSTFVIQLISFWSPNLEIKPYMTFLVYMGFTIGAYLLNTFTVRLLPLLDRIAINWALGGAIVIMIVILATARDHYQPASFVFGSFQNETGWSNSMAFALGLLQSSFGLTGFDGIAHIIEEMPRPSVNAPRTMVLAVVLGAGSSWIFLMVLLFCLTDFTEVVESAAGPLLTIYYQATSSMAGATCLLMFNVMSMAFTSQGLTTVASRMVYAVARDGLFGRFSNHFARIHPTLKVPVWAILFTSVWVTIFGLIYLGSATAFNAILSASVVLLQFSILPPIVVVLLQGEAALGPRKFNLGMMRRPINIGAVLFASFTCVLFCFPADYPATPLGMNYVSAVIGVVLILMLGTWFVDGRKAYTGPRHIVLYQDDE